VHLSVSDSPAELGGLLLGVEVSSALGVAEIKELSIATDESSSTTRVDFVTREAAGLDFHFLNQTKFNFSNILIQQHEHQIFFIH